MHILAKDVLDGKIFSTGGGGQQIGFWDCIAQKIDDRHVTQNDLSKIRDLVLRGSPWVPHVLSWHALAGSLFG